MKPFASQAWRKQGEAQAFDPGAWEFQSRQFLSSAKQLIQLHDAGAADPTFDSTMSLRTAVFLLALAIEQMAKAYYLKVNAGPREKIFNHSVVKLCGDTLFNEEQLVSMAYAEEFVRWAGRYPTPVWGQEKHKEAFDVPSVVVDGIECIDAQKIPNAVSRERAEQLLAVHETIHQAWDQAA